MKQELVKIDVKPPQVNINYEEAKKRCQAWLAQYKDVVITEDQVSEGRELAKEINQAKLSMKKTLRERIEVIEAPVRDLKKQVKHLEDMQEEVRQAILAQVAQYDQKKLDTIKSLLTDLRRDLWEDMEVEHEFRSAEFEDLATMGGLTPAWNLTGKVKAALESRVRDDKAMQDRTRMRLLELENRSYKAGLGSPLTREHVASFLYADDETYEARLQKLLDTEVQREQEARAKREREQEQDTARKAAVEKEEAERKERLAPAAPAPEPAPEPEPTPEPAQPAGKDDQEPSNDGRQAIRVVVHFATTVDPRVTDEAIETEIRRKLGEADFKTLDKIDIFRSPK